MSKLSFIILAKKNTFFVMRTPQSVITLNAKHHESTMDTQLLAKIPNQEFETYRGAKHAYFAPLCVQDCLQEVQIKKSRPTEGQNVHILPLCAYTIVRP